MALITIDLATESFEEVIETIEQGLTGSSSSEAFRKFAWKQITITCFSEPEKIFSQIRVTTILGKKENLWTWFPDFFWQKLEKYQTFQKMGKIA